MPASLTLLLAAAAAMLASALGILPLLRRPEPPRRWLGWANALAAGTMLGAAYLLLEACRQVVPAIAAALAGVGLIVAASRLAAGEGLDVPRLEPHGPAYGYQVFLRGSFHAACEGVALGAAFALQPSLGLFLAAALAIHNVAEATVLAAVLRTQGLGLARAAAAVTVAKAPQAALAVVAANLALAAPATLPWLAGCGVGALLTLVLLEPLPSAYHQAGRVSIAVVVAVALAGVVLLSAWGVR